MAAPNISELITTTLEHRSKKAADLVSKGNVLLNELKRKGRWRPAGGRSIYQELEYAEGNFQWYSGYETINIAPKEILTAAEFDWKQAASTVSINGLEKDVQNVGKEEMINLLDTRIGNAERTMKNKVCIGMYADGTGNDGKEFGGLQLLVADDPTTGTVGGISRASHTFWRNQVYDASTDGGAAATSANITSYMNRLYLRCVNGDEKPDIIVSDKNYYELYWASLQAIQRVAREDRAGFGFQELVYAGNVPVVYEDSTGIPANHMYFLNTDFIYFRYAPKRLFAPTKKREPLNQDAEVHMILLAGNLTLANAMRQGVLKA